MAEAAISLRNKLKIKIKKLKLLGSLTNKADYVKTDILGSQNEVQDTRVDNNAAYHVYLNYMISLSLILIIQKFKKTRKCILCVFKENYNGFIRSFPFLQSKCEE